MENIVIFIIIAIISALFGKKKKAEQKPIKQAQQSQQSQQVKPITENPFKNLGDFSKDFMEQQKQKMDRKPPIVKKEPVLVEKVERVVGRDQGVPRSSGRLSVHQGNIQETKVSKPIITNILPTSKDDLVKAIVFSEILAPPKSRR